MELLDVNLWMQQLIKWKLNYIESRRHEEDFANNMTEDNANIRQFIILKYTLLTLRLVIVIMFIAYYVGIFMYILFQLISIYQLGVEDNTFIQLYSFENRSAQNKILTVMYYAFTTLATVGFGDCHPKNSGERIVVSICLLMGVATFSYCMGIFIGILNTFKSLDEDFNEGE